MISSCDAVADPAMGVLLAHRRTAEYSAYDQEFFESRGLASASLHCCGVVALLQQGPASVSASGCLRFSAAAKASAIQCLGFKRASCGSLVRRLLVHSVQRVSWRFM